MNWINVEKLNILRKSCENFISVKKILVFYFYRILYKTWLSTFHHDIFIYSD